MCVGASCPGSRFPPPDLTVSTCQMGEASPRLRTPVSLGTEGTSHLWVCWEPPDMHRTGITCVCRGKCGCSRGRVYSRKTLQGYLGHLWLRWRRGLAQGYTAGSVLTSTGVPGTPPLQS